MIPITLLMDQPMTFFDGNVSIHFRLLPGSFPGSDFICFVNEFFPPEFIERGREVEGGGGRNRRKKKKKKKKKKKCLHLN